MLTQAQRTDRLREGQGQGSCRGLTGNDSLTAEGELEKTQAQKRKEATRVEALADPEAAKAQAEATEAKFESAAERSAVNAEGGGRRDRDPNRAGRAEAGD
jgi:hypothetical protein